MSKLEETLESLRKEAKETIDLFQRNAAIHYAINYTQCFDPTFAKIWKETQKLANEQRYIDSKKVSP